MQQDKIYNRKVSLFDWEIATCQSLQCIPFKKGKVALKKWFFVLFWKWFIISFFFIEPYQKIWKKNQINFKFIFAFLSY